MRNFSEMDKHYDRHNEGICSICGCTTERWKWVCDACRDEAIQEQNLATDRAFITSARTQNAVLQNKENDMSNKTISITLTGEVTPTYPKHDGRFWLFYSSDEYVELELDALSQEDRKIVEEKLKAWEGGMLIKVSNKNLRQPIQRNVSIKKGVTND